MFIEYVKLKDEKEMMQKIQDRIVWGNIALLIANAILELAEQKKGKQINANFVKPLIDKFPGYDMYYYTIASQRYIKVKYRNMDFQFFLCYDNNKVVNPELIKENLKGHLLEKERNEKRELLKERIPFLVEKWNNSLSCLKEYSKIASYLDFPYEFDICHEK